MDSIRFIDGPWQREPTEAERRAARREDLVEYRESYGLPVTEEIAETLLRMADLRDGGMSGRWLLPAERRLFARREREVFRHARRIRRYLDEEAAGDHADLRLVHAGEGALEVRLARNLDRHADALRKLVPRPEILRFRSVPRSAAELTALQERIEDEVLGSPADGLNVSGVGQDLDSGQIVVWATCPDPDLASRMLADRYGDAVRLEFLGTESKRLEPVPWTSYTVEARDLTVYWFTCAAYRFDAAVLEEADDRVVVTVREWVPNTLAIPLAGINRQATVRLTRELGDRAVVDGLDGTMRARYADEAAEPRRRPRSRT